MASHRVTFNIPERELGRADIEFRVQRNGSLLGTLKISRGAVVWTPAYAQRGRKVSWTKFDEFMRRRRTSE